MKHLLIFLALLFSHQKNIDPNNLAGDFDPAPSQAIFNNQVLSLPALAEIYPPPSLVLGQTTANKRIEIDLTNQRLYAYEDNNLIYNFLISSGKWGRTPTGTFQIWTKLRYTKMEGGSKAINTYYYLPNVPYTMFFYNNEVPKYKGYGLHGTYWHDNFGHPMSHGCINMKTEEVAQLYYWANLDTPIIIYGKAPFE